MKNKINRGKGKAERKTVSPMDWEPVSLEETKPASPANWEPVDLDETEAAGPAKQESPSPKAGSGAEPKAARPAEAKKSSSKKKPAVGKISVSPEDWELVDLDESEAASPAEPESISPKAEPGAEPEAASPIESGSVSLEANPKAEIPAEPEAAPPKAEPGAVQKIADPLESETLSPAEPESISPKAEPGPQPEAAPSEEWETVALDLKAISESAKEDSGPEEPEKKSFFGRFPYYQALAGAAGALVLLLVILFIALPKNTFSTVQQRALARLQKISAEDIWNSRYAQAVQDHVRDHFPFREDLIRVYNLAESFAGAIERNGVYPAGKGGFVEDIVVPDEAVVGELVEKISGFAAAHPDASVRFLLAPNAANICRSRIAVDAPIADQNIYMDDFFAKLRETWVTAIDVRKELREHSEEYLYYRTDPRWTTTAAKIALNAAEPFLKLGISEDTFSLETFSAENQTFIGKLAAANGLFKAKADEIQVYRAAAEPVAAVYENPDGSGEGRTLASIYDESCLGTPPPYDVSYIGTSRAYNYFFGGDYPLMRLTSSNGGSGRLLVIKDSYANCFLPFLAEAYEQIDVVDPRYYTGDLDALMQEDSLTEVLFLFNANTLFSDNSLLGMLSAGKA